jgi:hypothetical protein
MWRNIWIVLGTFTLITVANTTAYSVESVQRPDTADASGRSPGAYEYQREPTTVRIDIKPDGYPNRVNPWARGVVPVAILGGDTFDVLDIDVTTLAFGRDGASPAHNLGDSFTYNDHLRDVNLDGYMDLVTHYEVRDTGIACDDTSAALFGVFTTRAPCIDFIASNPLPESSAVTARKGPGTGCDTMIIDVVVSQVADLYGAAFDVIFPADLASFGQSSAEDSALTSDGEEIIALAREAWPGQLVVGISRLGAVPGIDVVEGLLIRLRFEKIGAEGTAPLDFDRSGLFDPSVSPGGIPGINWYGGLVTVEETTVGNPFAGSDSIRTVGCRDKWRPAIWLKDEEPEAESMKDRLIEIRRK